MAADNIVANGLAMFNRLLADKSHELVHIKKCVLQQMLMALIP
jgi:hypothetical protein